MRSGVGVGLVAGAVGTAALNIATYVDMVIRGRPASEVPAKLAGAMTERLGINLGGEGQHAGAAVEHRRTGLGALMGYVTGLGVGAVYGVLRPLLRYVPLPLTGATVGLAAMAVSDIPATLLGATDPAGCLMPASTSSTDSPPLSRMKRTEPTKWRRPFIARSAYSLRG